MLSTLLPPELEDSTIGRLVRSLACEGWYVSVTIAPAGGVRVGLSCGPDNAHASATRKTLREALLAALRLEPSRPCKHCGKERRYPQEFAIKDGSGQRRTWCLACESQRVAQLRPSRPDGNSSPTAGASGASDVE